MNTLTRTLKCWETSVSGPVDCAVASKGKEAPKVRHSMVEIIPECKGTSSLTARRQGRQGRKSASDRLFRMEGIAQR